jgi:hypothetical protein
MMTGPKLRPVVADVLDIVCDEAGHTGPDLLAKDQRIFSFSSVELSDAEAFEIVRKARADHPVQMPELKASRLLATDRGRNLIAALLAAIEGRYIVSVADKLLALCGWLFEYIYEPVYQHNRRRCPLMDRSIRSSLFFALLTATVTSSSPTTRA